MTAREGNFKSTLEFGQNLVAADHYAKQEISEKVRVNITSTVCPIWRKELRNELTLLTKLSLLTELTLLSGIYLSTMTLHWCGK